MKFNSPILLPWWLKRASSIVLLDASILTTIDEKKRGTTINSLYIFEGCYWGKKMRKFINTVNSVNNLNIQKIELLKIKLSHKLPSKEKYLLSKTFTFDNSNSHFLEQTHFIVFRFELSRVNLAAAIFFH